MHHVVRAAALLSLAIPAPAQPETPEYQPRVAPASDEAREAMARFEVADGLEVSLFAAEPMLANPVIFCVDEKGAFYVAETFRHHRGVTDNRNHANRKGWLDDELACQTVEDRVAMYQRHLGDGFAGYLTEHERIRWIIDDDGDGVADRARVFADGFNQAADGIAAGLLADRGKVYYACIPKLWLLDDRDGDGVADDREALHDGFGVRTALLGHDMHGLCYGPDGRLYFSIGDRGFDVTTHEGKRLSHPDTGAVLRCNRDGSELEIFATGLRNPQELAFDDLGNLFTGENNSDGGDRARWVYVVEGGDSGWLMSYQYLPTRGPWNEERLWYPHFEGQAAWIVPPITNLGNGPSGLAYDTGLGLPARFRDTFFLCDFRGGSSNSGVHTIKVEPDGAGFKVVEQDRLIWRTLVTDVDFGVDGAVYVTDWSEGWNQTGKGRIYRIGSPGVARDPEVMRAAALLREGMTGRTTAELVGLLGHADRRVRQRAQFELADRGAVAAPALAAAARAADGRLARVHAIWALGQIGRRDPAVLDPVLTVLDDADDELRIQAARVLGDARVAAAGPALERLLDHANGRVKYAGAMALGHLGRAAALPKVLAMVDENNDRDPWLRHAGVMALSRICSVEALVRAAEGQSPAVRTALLVALRKLKSPEVAGFLGDPQLTLEAARAIHDVPIPAAMPALADLVTSGERSSRPLLRRVFSACLRVGNSSHAAALAGFASDPAADARMRTKALETLGDWAEPPARDPVLGLWRPIPARPGTAAIDALQSILPKLRGETPQRVQSAAVDAVGSLAATDLAPALIDVIRDARATDDARIKALRTLEHWKHPSLALVAEAAALDERSAVRREAFRITSLLNPEAALPALSLIVKQAPLAEQRQVLEILAKIEHEAADAMLMTWLDRLIEGEVAPELQLDLIEAASQRDSEALASKLDRYADAKPDDDPLSPYIEALAGGDARRGERLFRQHPTATCMRCHRIGDQGGDGEAGPDLDGVGARLERRELLESLVSPTQKIAAGFGTVVVTLEDGSFHAGLLQAEDDVTITLAPADGPAVTIAKARVSERTKPVSAMPPMAGILTAGELRDLVEYLASLR